MMSKNETKQKHWCNYCEVRFHEPAKKRVLVQWGTLKPDGTRVTFHDDSLLCCPSCYSVDICLIVAEGKMLEEDGTDG